VFLILLAIWFVAILALGRFFKLISLSLKLL
jgi:hypothetical protein